MSGEEPIPSMRIRNLQVHYHVPMYRPFPPRPTRNANPRLIQYTSAMARYFARSTMSILAPLSEGLVKAVDGFSLDIAPGETVGLVGETGCGKSSTGRALLKLESAVGGTVEVEGTDVMNSKAGTRTLHRKVQMIFQDPYASLDPRMKVRDIIEEPLRGLRGELNAKQRRKRVMSILQQCGLDTTDGQRYPHEFSGGQRQRIAIARALAPSPQILIADEPVSALDASVQAQIVNLLSDLQSTHGLSILFIAHDLAVVRHVSHRIAVMYFGRIVELANAKTLTEDPKHPYTQALLQAVPVAAPNIERRKTSVLIEGDLPSPLRPPSGCSFHPRCSQATERCFRDPPLLKIGKLNRQVACHVAHDEA
ncbi:MAG: ATP-binding cassette domain-containing protein [Deltaproteobacteria bacterium]|nr:ATP-binding cassette domain-containing protein [Deltaproteobacteria bacterium]